MSSVVVEQLPEPSRFPSSLDPLRLLGALLLAAVFVGAFVVADTPNLDGVREEVAFATTADAVRAGVPADQVSNCFQGFCFEDDAGALSRWWSFSTTFLRLTWGGLVLALLAAAIVDSLLSRSRSRLGTVFPESDGAPRVRFGGPVGVGGLNAPTLVASAVLFSPLVVGIRVGLAVAGVALIAVLVRSDAAPRADNPPAREGLASALRRLVRSYVRLLLTVGPLFLVAAAVGGILPQYLTVAGVTGVVGDHMLGVGLVVVVGLALRLPIMWELPLVTAALLIGMGRIPAAVLLFTAALGGPLWRRGTHRWIATAGLAAVSLFGGGIALASTSLVEAATVPVVAFDGESCTYSGPPRLGLGVNEFVVRNDTVDAGDGKTMAMVVGRLPDNVSMDHFELEVAAAPTADLPGYFTVAGTREFVFPGTEEVGDVTLHQPGRYAAVCLNGGGFYVIFEFSMEQPPGWFDEFRSTFVSHVAPEVFTVEG